MDIDDVRKRIQEIVGTASAYRVVVETEDAVLYDMPVFGSDALQVFGIAAVSIMAAYAVIEELPPTGQLVVRINPETE